MRLAIAILLCLSTHAGAEGLKLGDALKTKAKDVTINIQVNGANVEPAKKHGFFVCSVEAFTEKFEATGETETATKFKVKKECTAKHDEMFCKNITCDGEAESTGQWICKVKAFGDSFEELGDSKAEAKYKVKKDCLAKNHEMHCSDISCEQ